MGVFFNRAANLPSASDKSRPLALISACFPSASLRLRFWLSDQTKLPRLRGDSQPPYFFEKTCHVFSYAWQYILMGECNSTYMWVCEQ